jgi:hypothetical protein
MPLLDHFHPPLYPHHQWQSFYSSWATRLADALMERAPREFQAEEHIRLGPTVEIDISGDEWAKEQLPAPQNGPTPDTPFLVGWVPPAARYTMPALSPETFEVRIFSTEGGLTLVAAIELISPGNKDRPEERRAFAVKCASYLYQGVALIVIDIVTSRRANLHNEVMRLMAADPQYEMTDDSSLYAVAYRPVLRQERPEIDLWPVTFRVGEPLPVLPLRLTGDLFVPVDFEAAYQEACRRRRPT